MQIVLPGALPPRASIAAALATHLPTVAPTLFAWMCLAKTQQTPFDLSQHGCTPFESWQLNQAGFHPAPGQPVGAGLAPLRAGHAAAVGETVWLAELAHVAIGLQHTNLLSAQYLDLSPAHGNALFEAAQAHIEATPFKAHLLTPYRWRIHVPPTFSLPTLSPEAVMGTSLHHAWNVAVTARPWRHLMNEIQMVWHEHPVNLERAAWGQLPINGLWLYGGGLQWPHTPRPPRAASTIVIKDLIAPFRAEDWNQWLSTLQHLDATIFKPHTTNAGAPTQPLTITLFGTDRSVEFTVRPPGRFLRHLLHWLPSPHPQNWRTWWFPLTQP